MPTGKSIEKIAPLNTGTATTAQIATALNLLLKELQDRGWMDS